MKTTRRRLLQTAALSPAAAAAIDNLAASSPSSLYSSLGVKPVINGVGVVTVLGGSIMPPEVLRAMEEAGRRGMARIALTGRSGGRLAAIPDVCALVVPAEQTSRIQEVHITIIHIWARLIEEALA